MMSWTQGDAEAQRPAARAARFRLQRPLSVLQACCGRRDLLRDKIREVGRGLSLADTQTGRLSKVRSLERGGVSELSQAQVDR